MNNKPPLQVSSYNLPSAPSPPMCFPSPKNNKRDNVGLCGCQRAPKSHCISAFGVIVLVLAYTAMGSILFMSLEGEDEDNKTVETAVAASKPYPRSDLVNADIRSRTVDRLWSITEDLNILYKENWTRLAAHEVQQFQDSLLRAVKTSKIQQTGVQPTIKPYKWSYASAFLYSLTLITTIEKLAEATRKYANLRTELSEAQEDGFQSKKSISRRKQLLHKKNVPARKIQELKLAFSEFYLGLILLQNYQNLNFTGFRKIFKKHDKLLNVDFGARWRVEHVEQAHFYTNKDIDRLIQETELVVTQDIEGGDRQKAMKRLRVPPLGEQQSPWITFKVGLFSGAFIVLLTAVLLSAIFHSSKDWRIATRLFGGPLLLIEFLFLWGVNVYGWRSSGVNHVLIFEMDPRNHLSEQHLMELASVFGVIWTICVLGFLFNDTLSIPTFASPLIMYSLMIIFLFNPTKTLRHEARFWTIRVIGRIILAPFFYVSFADFWVADQLNSIVPALLDIQYFICFYSKNSNWSDGDVDIDSCIDKSYFIRPFLAMLPAWFRFAQCLRRYRDTREAFPHLANALKYSTSFFVVIFSSLTLASQDSFKSSTENPWFYMWVISSIASSCYAYSWDIKMDWGLFDAKAGDNTFLREEVVYSATWIYYFAIVEDLILRFGWTLSMSLIEAGFVESELMITILSPLEVFRRFMWNFFRLENEHLNNCGKFRAVRDISVAPIDQSDQITILRMMDEEDGVVHRRAKSKVTKKKNDLRILLQGGDSIDDLDS